MEAITIPHIHIPSIDIGGICLPGIGVPDGGKKGLVWPAGLKGSIKAIYDPASQGMTNYDVIEAYAEDFTTWILDNNSADITVTNNKLIITETKIERSGIIRNSNANEDLILYVTGIDNTVRICYYNGTAITAIHNGLNKIHTDKNYIDFRSCVDIGTCNITITQLPTSILKDLSGNGNHAYLYGGKGKLNSGMGIYKEDFTSYGNKDAVINPFTAILTNNTKSLLFYYNVMTKDIESYNVKINGIVDEHIIFFYRNEEGIEQQFHISKDGNYAVPKCYRIGTSGVATGYTANNTNENTKITITQIPDYPDQLCYDGTMYAVCYGFPILTDYTVMADRTWFDFVNRTCLASKSTAISNGAFIFELYNNNQDEVFTFGKNLPVDFTPNNITYQAKNSYNDTSIASGHAIDTDILYIGKIRENEALGYHGCHGKIIIADRSFTEDEITWLKDNFFTIDIPTPAYDFDFSKLKSGENTFTDKYGNELSLHNFAWSGMSGKGGYNEDFTNWTNKGRGVLDIKPNSFTVTNVNVSNAVLIEKRDYNVRNNIVLDVKGIINESIYVGAFDKDKIIIEKDGIYKIDVSSFSSGTYGIGFIDFTGDCNITITQLPLYPNALVFDGIDDYCKLSKMTIKTVILDFVNLELNRQIYDNRDKPNNHYDFSIYPEADTIAYEARNSDGKTYIDGELNTTIKTNDLLEVRCIVFASNNSAKETEQYISKDSLLNNFYGKMALYRITGFTEVLTPDQVWKWYQKNQPKGGDK